MKTILAVDGSDNSYEAIHALKYFARSEQLTLLHAFNVPRPAYSMMLPKVAEDLYKTVEQNMRDDGERLLAGYSRPLLALRSRLQGWQKQHLARLHSHAHEGLLQPSPKQVPHRASASHRQRVL